MKSGECCLDHSASRVVLGLRSIHKSIFFVIVLVSQFQKVLFLKHSLGSEEENGPKSGQNGKKWLINPPESIFRPRMATFGGSVFFDFLFHMLLMGHQNYDKKH